MRWCCWPAVQAILRQGPLQGFCWPLALHSWLPAGLWHCPPGCLIAVEAQCIGLISTEIQMGSGQGHRPDSCLSHCFGYWGLVVCFITESVSNFVHSQCCVGYMVFPVTPCNFAGLIFHFYVRRPLKCCEGLCSIRSMLLFALWFPSAVVCLFQCLSLLLPQLNFFS